MTKDRPIDVLLHGICPPNGRMLLVFPKVVYLVLGFEVRDGIASLDLDLGTILATNTQEGTNNSVLISVAAQVVIENTEEHQRVDTGGKRSRLGQCRYGSSGAGNSVRVKPGARWRCCPSWEPSVWGRSNEVRTDPRSS